MKHNTYNIVKINQHILSLLEALSNEEVIEYYHNQKSDYETIHNEEKNKMTTNNGGFSVARDVLLHTVYNGRTIPTNNGEFMHCRYVDGVVVFQLNKYSNGMRLIFFVVPKETEDAFIDMVHKQFDFHRLEYRDSYSIENVEYVVYSILSDKDN